MYIYNILYIYNALSENLHKRTLIVILHNYRNTIFIGIIAYTTCFVQLYRPKGQILM